MISARLRSKLLLDPYYAPLAKRELTQAQLLRAGFFDDTLPGSVRDHASWMPSMLTTPVLKLKRQLQALRPAGAGAPPDLVLLSTGSFSPVHEGHLGMMEAARRHAQSIGYRVVGGYLSPSHDSYVSVKAGGAAAMHAELRIALLEEAVSDSDWLSVCPWEARNAPLALNFTDVLDRLQLYLNTHLSTHALEVAYVFGADNLGFIDAFSEQGIAFCVARTGIDQPTLVIDLNLGGRLHFVPAPSQTQASSTQVRAGDISLVPHAARPRYLATKAAPTGDQSLPVYLVRQDLAYGMRPWGVSAQAREMFECELLALLQGALQGHASVHGMPLVHANELALRAPVLSLDVCTPGEAHLDISRKFDVGGGQVYSREMTARPGKPSIELQLAKITEAARQHAGTPWCVVDDDKATGATQRAAARLLSSAGLKVDSFQYLNEHYLARRGLADATVFDVVDARDFLLGARDGGLAVELPSGALARAPYMLPFVNLPFRAKVPADRTPTLSRALWALNVRWFEHFAPSLTVREADPGVQQLLLELGFHLSRHLRLCCAELMHWVGEEASISPEIGCRFA